jgi:hypothetical protein
MAGAASWPWPAPEEGEHIRVTLLLGALKGKASRRWK